MHAIRIRKDRSGAHSLKLSVATVVANITDSETIAVRKDRRSPSCPQTIRPRPYPVARHAVSLESTLREVP